MYYMNAKIYRKQIISIQIISIDVPVHEHKFDLGDQNPKPKIDEKKPTINIISPNYSGKYYRTTDHIINISGKASDNEGVASVELNGSKVNINTEGKFIKKVQLQLGVNNIKILAKDLFGNFTNKELLIYRDEIIEEEIE